MKAQDQRHVSIPAGDLGITLTGKRGRRWPRESRSPAGGGSRGQPPPPPRRRTGQPGGAGGAKELKGGAWEI